MKENNSDSGVRRCFNYTEKSREAVSFASSFAYRDDSRSERRNYAKASFFRVLGIDDIIAATYGNGVRIAMTGINWQSFSRQKSARAFIIADADTVDAQQR